jgi:hypothetical protein
MEIEIKMKRFKCLFCDKTYKNKCNISTHIRTNHPEHHKGPIPKRTEYPCNYDNECTFIGASRSIRRNHIIKEHEKTFYCSSCDKYFCSERSLDMHFYKCHQS